MDNETQTWLTQANTALIRYPRFKALHQDMRECQELSRLSNEPCCLSLEGVTGAGKSTWCVIMPHCFLAWKNPTGHPRASLLCRNAIARDRQRHGRDDAGATG